MSDKIKPALSPEEERKAKAARAKKLLDKKRREKAKAGVEAANASKAGSEVNDGETPRASLDVERPAIPSQQQPSGVDAKEVVEIPLGKEEESELPTVGVGIHKPNTPQRRDDDTAVELAKSEELISAPPHTRASSPPSVITRILPEPMTITPSAPIEPITTKSLANTDHSDRRIAELESEIISLRTDSGMLAEARDLVSRLEAQKAELKDRLDAQEGELAMAKIARQDLEERERELGKVNERLEESELRGSEVQVALNEARERIRAMEVESESSGKEVESRLERQREREGGLEAEIVRLREAGKELEATSSQLQVRLETSEGGHSSTRADLETLQQQHVKLQGEHDALTSEREQKTTELESLRAATSSTEKDRKTLTNKIKQLEKQLQVSATEVDKLNKEVSAKTKQAEQALESRTALQEDNRELMAQLDEMRGRLEGVVAEREEAVQDLAGVRKRVEDLEISLQAASTDKEDGHSALQSIKGQLQAAETDLTLLRTELDATTKEQEEAQVTIQVLRAQTKGLQEQLSGARGALVDIAGQVMVEVVGSQSVEELVRLIGLKIRALSEEKDTLRVQQLEAKSATDDNAQNGGSPTDLDEADQSRLLDVTAQLRSAQDALHAESSRAHKLAREVTDMNVEIARLSREREEAIAKLAEPSSASRSGGLLFRSSPGSSIASPIAAAGPSVQSNAAAGRHPYIPHPAVRQAIDHDLPPSARHKRQVSLALLRARMGPSPAVDGHSQPRAPGTRSLSSRSASVLSVSEAAMVAAANEEDEVKVAIASEDAEALEKGRAHGASARHLHGGLRSQFGDEAIFWCANCEGDLITL